MEAAALAAPGVSLGATEIDIAGRILNGKHGFPGAFAPDVLPRLKALAAQRGPGKQIAEAMLAGALWQLKSIVPSEVRAFRRLAFDLVGPVRTGLLLARRKLGLARTQPGSVRERERALLPDAP